MTEPTLTPFDFRTANAWDPVTDAFQNWMETSAGNFADSWLTATGLTMKMNFKQVETVPFEKAVNGIEEELVGALVSFPSIASTLYLAISRIDFLKIVWALLGCKEVETEDRVLTRVEKNIGSLLFELASFVYSESWLGTVKLDGKVGEFESNAKRTKSLDDTQPVFAAEMVLEFDSQQCDFLVLVPEASISQQLKSFTNQVTVDQPQDPRVVLEQLPLRTMCLLGETELSMGELSRLKNGDVLFLEQRIDKPLLVSVDDKHLFNCWPGKVGNRQAIEVCTVLKGIQ